MIVLLIMGTKIIRTRLPKKVYGDYWISENIKDFDNKIINVEEENNKWKVKSNNDYKLLDSSRNEVEYLYLEDYKTYFIKVIKTGDIYLLYSSPSIDNNIAYLDIENIKEINIGKSDNADIVYKNNMLSDNVNNIYYIFI